MRKWLSLGRKTQVEEWGWNVLKLGGARRRVGVDVEERGTVRGERGKRGGRGGRGEG